MLRSLTGSISECLGWWKQRMFIDCTSPMKLTEE